MTYHETKASLGMTSIYNIDLVQFHKGSKEDSRRLVKEYTEKIRTRGIKEYVCEVSSIYAETPLIKQLPCPHDPTRGDSGIIITCDGDFSIVSDHLFARILRRIFFIPAHQKIKNKLGSQRFLIVDAFKTHALNQSEKTTSKIGSNTCKSMLLFIKNILKDNKTEFHHKYIFFILLGRNIIRNPCITAYNRLVTLL